MNKDEAVDTERTVSVQMVIDLMNNVEHGYKVRLDSIEKRLERCEYDSEREVLRRRVAELERIIATYTEDLNAR